MWRWIYRARNENDVVGLWQADVSLAVIFSVNLSRIKVTVSELSGLVTSDSWSWEAIMRKDQMSWFGGN